MTTLSFTVHLPDPAATTALAERVAVVIRPGDTILLSGPIGAGKSHFARAVIQTLMARSGRIEDVPSPTYTLVQTYTLPEGEILHSDLYRITSEDDLQELGLDEAFGQAICLVEWAERLGDLTPQDALSLTFDIPDAPGRILRGTAHGGALSERWQPVFQSDTAPT